jgi:uncharacterized membrane protein YqiK
MLEILQILVIVLVVVVVILGFTTYNLLHKNENAEDILVSYMEYLSKIDTAIEESDKRLKEIDARGIFKADDEIGWFFENILLLQSILNEFRIKKL